MNLDWTIQTSGAPAVIGWHTVKLVEKQFSLTFAEGIEFNVAVKSTALNYFVHILTFLLLSCCKHMTRTRMHSVKQLQKVSFNSPL